VVLVGVAAGVDARIEVQPDVSLNLVPAAMSAMIADRPHRLLIPLLVALSLSPTTAWAQPSDSDRATARTLANEGQEALDKGDYKTAVDRFSRADALFHAPTLLLALARAQVGLGKLVSASETYNRIVSEGATPKSPPQFVKAVEDATKELEALGARIGNLVVEVRGSDGASVTLDGEPVPNAALGVKRPTDPGEHVLRATAPGMTDASVKFTLAEGATRNVTLELKPPTPGGGGAVDEAKPSSTQKMVGIALAGVGGAGLVLGGITGSLALNQHGELAKLCNAMTRICPSGQQDALNSFHTVSAISTIGFAVGGAAVAAGVILILTAPSPKRAEPAVARQGAVEISPVIGAGYLGVTGRF
jgi:hypothetical protein